MDDIQWADHAALRVLAQPADHVTRLPIMVVCGLSDNSIAPRAPTEIARLWNHRSCERIELPRLSQSDVTEYVHAICRQDKLRVQDRVGFIRTLFERSGGNPLLMVDLLHTLDAGQCLNVQRLGFSRMALQSAHDRLRALSPVTLDVLGAAAVIGRRFDVGVLSHVTGRRPIDVWMHSVAR